jgi:hypothetical protein
MTEFINAAYPEDIYGAAEVTELDTPTPTDVIEVLIAIARGDDYHERAFEAEVADCCGGRDKWCGHYGYWF